MPFHNESEYLSKCISNLNNLYEVIDNFEVIFINSNSTNGTQEILNANEVLFSHSLVSLEVNSGPGTARNAGLKQAEGTFILFLDVDDFLDIEGFLSMSEELNSVGGSDVLSFNWLIQGDDRAFALPRRDNRSFSSKCSVITQFARHHMEASVIYSVFNRNFLDLNKIKFTAGLHEDISFLFESYLKAESIQYLDSIVYVKVRNPASITSTISEEHISGYLNNYEKVSSLLEKFVCIECASTHSMDMQLGAEAAVASRLREIARLTTLDSQKGDALVQFTKNYVEKSKLYSSLTFQTQPKQTTYGKILKLFKSEESSSLLSSIRKIDGLSWSCKDLHHSVFFAPKELRTCCKRFFVDGDMRGDVVLDVKLEKGVPIEPKAIQISKRNLWVDINYGEPNACEQCPFLEYSEWQSLEKELELHLISMEQHSVCNLRCTYCDDTFYGGARPIYDIEKSIEKLSSGSYLDHLELVVWGGGEPLLDPNFVNMLNNVNKAAPKAHNRILSNSLRHSSEVQNLLVTNRASLVTSLDAGTPGTYQVVRGRKGIEKVFENLHQYSLGNSKRITVKYIFTRLNTSSEEIDAFCAEVEKNALTGCYFQISSDFKEEWMTQEMLEAAILLYAKLRKLDVYYVYLDEHIWQRWASSHTGSYDSLPLQQLAPELHGYIAKPDSEEPFFIWGTGQLTKMLFRTGLVSRWNIAGIVDSTPNRIGTKIEGFVILDPEVLKGRNEKIFLSSVQSIVLMKEESERLDIGKERLLQKLLW